MFGFDNIDLTFAIPAIYFFIALILIAVYTVYVYRYTIPQIPQSKKIILVSLRTLGLLILVFILFEPILNLSRKLILEPVNLVFIDNSRSMTIDDGTDRTSKVKKILNDFSDHSAEDNFSFYTFGNSIQEISDDSLEYVNFKEGVTNFEDIFNSVKNSEDNIASITLITDGVITSGDNPYYNAIGLGIPVFSIGIGDTTQRKDVEIKKVLHNDFIYAETPTNIIASISNKGFANESVTASLYEDNKFISQQTVKLSDAGIQNVSFDYQSKNSGEKKLSIVLSSLKDEFTIANNKHVFYVNVLSNKIKVLLLASSPSSDLTFIKNSLRRDENLEVNSVVQISGNKFLDELNYKAIDSADVFFLIGFPSDKTPEELINRTLKRISEEKIPYFLTLSPGVSLNKLMRFGNELSFTTAQSIPGFKEVQPNVTSEQINNPLFKQGDKSLVDYWSNLPPVTQPNNIFTPRVESKTLAQIKLNNNVINSPLILTKNFSGKRSITILAGDIWKWKLMVAQKGVDLFDNFIVNSLRWLKANEEQKLVNVKTSKKSFSQGERVEFSAEVFDESLNPISDAEIKIKINSDKYEYETEMQNVGSGLYEGSMMINETGDFRFTADAFLDGRSLGKDKGNFNIGEIDLEMMDPVMNFPMLSLLSKETDGEFFYPNKYGELFSKFRDLNRLSSGEKVITSEISLWSNTWMLVIAVLLFSLEWFIRKRNGML